MHRKPDFDVLGKHWPHASASRFVTVSDLRLHVQVMGEGAPVLLIHGTGASTHSFRDMMPALAKRYRVIAVDVPGHGFSDTAAFNGMSLPSVAAALTALTEALDAPSPAVVAHSAGAAIALEMARGPAPTVGPVVAFNGSLKPYAGAAAPIFSAMARALFVNPMTPRLFATTASNRRVRQLIEGTGSTLSAEGLEYYRTLFRSPGHVHGALSMMAAWDLAPLNRALREITVPVTLVAAAQDRAISPMVSADAARRLPSASLVRLARLGHLAHEEDPKGATQIVLDALHAANHV